jgi:phospholipid-transporting ATPase
MENKFAYTSLYIIHREVNLKIKQALPETAHVVSPSQLQEIQGVIKSEQPNNRLYNYDGTFSLSDQSGKTRELALDPNKLLLRGAQLRNTSWIYGVAIFTGHESKLMLNSRYVLLQGE